MRTLHTGALIDNVSMNAVPEPLTIVLLSASLLSALGMRRRSLRKRSSEFGTVPYSVPHNNHKR
jgi:hypothetical protein